MFSSLIILIDLCFHQYCFYYLCIFMDGPKTTWISSFSASSGDFLLKSIYRFQTYRFLRLLLDFIVIEPIRLLRQSGYSLKSGMRPCWSTSGHRAHRTTAPLMKTSTRPFQAPRFFYIFGVVAAVVVVVLKVLWVQML